MTEHIGIVACSAEGASLCYRTICREGPQLLGPHAHPQITMHTPSLAGYMACLECEDIDGIGDLMLGSAEILANAGADFLICPDNTVHQAMGRVRARSPLPWLHIAEIVAGQATERGCRRLGVTGTRSLTLSRVYPDVLEALGLEWVRPAPEEIDEIDRVIIEELVYGEFKPSSIATFQRTITRMKAQGCDAVILGCTEIPLILDDGNSPLPTLDSTRLLARAALRRAVGA